MIFVFLFFCFVVCGNEQYRLSICAIFGNESKNLKEWIEYHRLVGVDHFYLYNNGLTRSIDVLKPYIKDKIVTLVHWPDYLGEFPEEKTFLWSLSTQTSAYANAIKLREDETKWLVFVDVDEFLIPINGTKLTEVLERYEQYPGIVLQKDFFDSSIKNILPKRRLIIETVEMTAPPKQNIQRSVEKIIFKPRLCESFTWPPFRCVFKDNKKALEISKKEIRINQYINRNVGLLNSGKIREKLYVDQHFMLEEEIRELLKNGYEIEDQERHIYRFVPDVLKKMGF